MRLYSYGSGFHGKPQLKTQMSDYELTKLRSEDTYTFRKYHNDTYADEYFEQAAAELKTLTKLEKLE